MAGRIQLTTDGHKGYLDAVEGAFGREIDYAMLVKMYGGPTGNLNERRYSAGECCGMISGVVCGAPDEFEVSTSYVERQNLNMRMNMRRFTRLTNAFSKKIENHVAMLALFHMHYNFVRVHQTLRVTPAMEAGITQHVWSIQDICGLISEAQALAA